METEPTKVSIKTMKEVIRGAGLATADLFEKAGHRGALQTSPGAARRSRGWRRRRRRRIAEESCDGDGGPDSLIPRRRDEALLR